MFRLQREEYSCAQALVATVPFNQLFARAVIEVGAPGEVFVDRKCSPRVVYVVHRYGMSLLAAAPEERLTEATIACVLKRRRATAEWLQIHARDGLARFIDVAGASVERHTRVNFEFRPERAAAHRARHPTPDISVTRVDRALFSAMVGSVVPSAFWNRERFLREGIGFAVLRNKEVASLAFSSWVLGPELEIGIETAAPYRGGGLAEIACFALVKDCQARGLLPVWACREGNVASHRLAEKLGFIPMMRLPYLRLQGAREDRAAAR